MELFQDLFNPQTLANMAIVSALVTAIRNVVKLRGAAAVALTFLVSITYGVLQFGLSTEYGVTYGAVVGIATALTFYLSKNMGAILQRYMPMQIHLSAETSFSNQRGAIIGEGGKLTVWNIVKFILFRKL